MAEGPGCVGNGGGGKYATADIEVNRKGPGGFLEGRGAMGTRGEDGVRVILCGQETSRKEVRGIVDPRGGRRLE